MSRGIFHGRCYLCGSWTRNLHCWAHDWADERTAPAFWEPSHPTFDTNLLHEARERGRAEGLAQQPEPAPDPEPPFTLTRLHEWWLERHTPAEIVELATHVEAISRSGSLTSRPAGHLELVANRSKSPAGRPPLAVELASVSDRKSREAI